MKLLLSILSLYLLFATSCYKKDPSEEGCFGELGTQLEEIEECNIGIAILDDFDTSRIGVNRSFNPISVELRRQNEIIPIRLKEFRPDEFFIVMNYFYLDDSSEYLLALDTTIISLSFKTNDYTSCEGNQVKSLSELKLDEEIIILHEYVFYPIKTNDALKTYEYHL